MIQMKSKTCLGCFYPLPQPFLDLGEMPLANAFFRPEQAGQKEEPFHLAVAYCPNCHLVQLTDLVPPEKLFGEYLYFSSYSDAFLAHAKAMAQSLTERFQLGPESRVIEIASNDGYLLQYFQQRGIPVLGVEPAKNIAAVAESRGIPTLNRFFGPDVVRGIQEGFGPADLVIGNNVLAHVPTVNEFLQAVGPCLKQTGTAVFEFPYVKELLDRTEFDTIYHEHVFYYSLTAMRILAQRAGLELHDVTRQPVHGGSLRVFLQHKGMSAVSSNVTDLLAEEKAAGLTGLDRYTAFSRDVAVLRDDLVHLLRDLKAAGKRLAAYGAAAKGSTLLNYCGIGPETLDFVVDRSPYKQGRYMPGERLPIHAPERLLEVMPDYVLLLAWNFADEIMAQQQAYYRKGGKFIIPVPKPKIV
ncbi:MAG: class I SAM-dependent methyltransferase [Nitrospirae bacterium]|nr:class I SAM-dependent methyltransferase [Nitrospirota bacterium]